MSEAPLGLPPSPSLTLFPSRSLVDQRPNSRGCAVDFDSGKDHLVAINSLIFAVSFAVNLLTLWPVVRQVRQRNILAVYLLGLSLSDLLYVLTLPLWIVYFSRGHDWSLGLPACYFAGFVFYSNMYVGVCLLCAVSADRYLAVVYPLRSKCLRRPKVAAWLVVLVVLGVFCCHLPVLVLSAAKDSNSTSDWEPTNTSTQTQTTKCFDHLPLYTSIAVVNYARVSLGFVLPLLAMIFCYHRLLKGVEKSHSLDGEQKAKVQRLSFAIIIIFSLCFAPYHLLLLVRTLNFSLREDSCPFERSVQFYFNLSQALVNLNSAIDPILYVLVSDSVKKDIRESLLSLCSSLPRESVSIGSRLAQCRTTSIAAAAATTTTATATTTTKLR